MTGLDGHGSTQPTDQNGAGFVELWRGIGAGGLAAPALAAVAGSLLTTAGAGAAAGALTSAVGSTVGTAALIGAFGAGGGHAVGGRMAHRLGHSRSRSLPVYMLLNRSQPVRCVCLFWEGEGEIHALPLTLFPACSCG